MKLFSQDEPAERAFQARGKQTGRRAGLAHVGPNLRGEYDFFGTRPRGKLFLLQATIVSWCCSHSYIRYQFECLQEEYLLAVSGWQRASHFSI